jgi:hypothetical protein
MRPSGRALLFIAITLSAAPPAAAAVSGTRDANVAAATLGAGTTGAFEAIPPVKNNSGYDTFPVATYTDDPAAGFPTQGNSYLALSNGDAPSVKGFNASGVSSLGGPNVRGNTDFDVTVLRVDFTAPADANCLSFDFRMLSREYPSYVGGKYNDAFIAELDKSTWKTQDSQIAAADNFAFDPGGKVISINAAGETSMKQSEGAGTTYSSHGATPLLHAYTPVTPGKHSLYLSIFDQGDALIESTVLVDNLQARNVSGGCAKGAATGAPKPVTPPAPAPTPSPAPVLTAAPKPVPTPAPVVAKSPPAFGKGGVAVLPSAKECVSRRKFRMRIKERPNFEISLASVFVNGKLTSTLKQKVFGKLRHTARVDLRGLPKGTWKVRIVVVATDGRVVTGTRRYRTCSGKGGRPNKGPL